MATTFAALASMITFASALQPSARPAEMKQGGAQQTMAICMSGAARTVVDSDVQEGFNSHVRNSRYARGLSGAVPDLFMYVRIGDSTNPRHPYYLDETSEAAVEKALEALNPTVSQIDKSSGKYDSPSMKELGVDPACFQRGGFWDVPQSVSRTMNFFEGWHTCHKMVEQQEASFGEKYDLVMFTRPDLLWKQDIPMSWFSPNAGYVGIDWWMILPRNISKDLANTLPEYFLARDEACCNMKAPEWIVYCRSHNSCKENNKTCYVVGRGEVLGERIKRPDGTEDWTHFWDGVAEFKEVDKYSPEQIARLGPEFDELSWLEKKT